MFFFPLGVDVPMGRIPWMNWLLMGLIGLCFIGQGLHPDLAYPFILGIDGATFRTGLLTTVTVRESPLSWIGHMFLHGGFMHVAGNLMFMWVFGNAVCAKVGNLPYVLVWIGLGLVAALAHTMASDAAVIGASGAINGVVGVYFILYPLNNISMFYFVFAIVRIFTGTFELASYWMILLWFAFDVLGVVSGGGGVAYAAHLGGFAGGAGLAVVLLKARLLEADEYERDLLEILLGTSTGSRHRESRDEMPEADRPDPALMARRLHVQLGGGKRKQAAVIEFLRHEGQGKDVDHFVVSEDGRNWTTFGDWRKRHRT